MKRLRVDDTRIITAAATTTSTTIKEVTGSSPVATATLYNHSFSGTPVLTYNTTTSNTITNIKVVSEGMQSGLYPPAPVSYGAMPAASVPHSGKSTPIQPLSVGSGVGGNSQLRTTGSSPPTAPIQEMQSQQQQQTQQQSPGGNFQRLKVEDALSYLDLVKFKFGSKPQVYNDFLDIMKEFKSQSIDTPGVIQRVSNLFKGFPELIMGFNTFLPPGYKIEVQKSDQGYAFQVSVSMPSPTGNLPSDPQQQKMIMRGSGTINVSGSVPIQSIQPCQPLPLTQHVPQTVTTAAPPPPPPQQQQPPQQPSSVPVVHHSSNYSSGTTIYNNSLSLSTSQVSVSQALQGHTDTTPQNQPVQFNHAINYVNKIKNRFQDQPEKYKRFLDILHIYQKEQRTMKESSGIGPGSGKHLTEQEVYSQVAKLFENQSDLLAEFGQFLPDATNNMNQQPVIGRTDNSGVNNNSSSSGGVSGVNGGGSGGTGGVIGGGNSGSVIGGSGGSGVIGNNIPNSASCGSGSVVGGIGGSVSGGGLDHVSVVKKPPTKQSYNRDNMIDRHITHKPSHISGHLKRSPTYPALMHRDGGPPPKKHKMSSCKDVTLAEAGKYGTLNDYAFFDKVRKALRTQEVYNNFLRCLILFNQEIISKSELIMIVTPFLGKFPELMRWFREFLGQNDVEPIPYNVTRTERPQGEQQLEIDLATAKRLGASYCVIPPSQEGLTCSGRTQLCKEVLNDQWVSFPTWSEDSTFVSSRKTQYEEYMYRCEDERFELDVVIETNASTIRVLEGVAKKLNRMNADEVNKFRLDDCLGGSSPTLHQRALKRIYGDKANEIIEGLKRNPAVAVPVVLRRLKAKEEEWREAQKGFNKLWREQNEKYYLKSLDHQGINFKQTDVKALRSKSLFNEIETIFDERHEQNEEGVEPIIGPHLIIPYKDRTILDDAANLLIHHVKRQTGIQKGEKLRIKHLLRQFLPELFFHPKQQLTDDERDDDDEKEEGDESPNSSPNVNNSNTNNNSSNKIKGGESSPGKSPGRYDGEIEIKPDPDLKDEDAKTPLHAQTNDPDEAYTLFMANNNWYIFLRLHAILCERLAKIYERAVALAAEESKNRTNRKESTAIALRLKPKPQIEIEDYYVAFLDMVKNLLDNNMDANTYEDTLREMFGIHAYVAFTLDKVVSYAVRQLQHCVTERTAIACTDLFTKEQKRGSTGGSCSTAHRRQHLEFAYQRTAEKAVQDENCFKIYIYKKDCRMTIELMDTDSEDSKKVDETKKWSNYKECYADCTNVDNKRHSPVYLNRNLRIYKKRMGNGNNNSNNNNNKDKKNSTTNPSESSDDQDNNKQRQSDDNKKRRNSNGGSTVDNVDDNDKRYGILDEFERKLERPLPNRNQSEHPGYEVSDETQCKFNSQDSKIMYAVNKDSYLYKISAFYKARKSHPTITKRLSSKFRAWLKRWASENVSDVQHKQCIDWLMGRGDGVVPNRTRVLTDNDLTRTPYIPYNRYRVERLNEDTT